MSYLWHSYTGYDRQRIFMEEHVGNKVRTKRYVGNCEYVAYGLKDNLGSWTTITDENIQYGSDLVFGMIGYAPGGGIISTFWFLGGRELVFQYGETMGLLLEDGINPGYPVYQPFK